MAHRCCGLVKCTIHCGSTLNKTRCQACYSCSTLPYYCTIQLEEGTLIIDVDRLIFNGETLFEASSPFTKNEVSCLNHIRIHTVDEYVRVIRHGRMYEIEFCKPVGLKGIVDVRVTPNKYYDWSELSTRRLRICDDIDSIC